MCFCLGSLSSAWQPATKFAVGPDMLYLVMLRKSGSLELGVSGAELLIIKLCEWLAANGSMLGRPWQGIQGSFLGTVVETCLRISMP